MFDLANRKRTLRAFLGAAVVGLGLSGAASAQTTTSTGVPCPPLPNCPPGSGAPVVPFDPNSGGNLGNLGNSAMPGGPIAPAPMPEPTSDTSSGNRIAQSPATRSMNMMGDLLGARSLRVGFTVPITARFTNITPTVDGAGGPAVSVNPNSTGGRILFGPTPNGNIRPADASFSTNNLTYTQPTSLGNATFDRDFARSALQTLLSNGPLTQTQIEQLNKLSPADRAALLANRGAVNTAITKGAGGLSLANVTVGEVKGDIAGNVITYTAILNGETTVALPGSSSSVGRVKMSEDNNPLPRDRFIFNYDTFSNVPYTTNGLTVSRYQFGVEKTFWDGRWSFEARLPFASTLASTYTDGAEMKDLELGNVRLALKKLWTNSERFNISSGVAVTLPTAEDQVVLSSQAGVGELYRFKNQSVTVEPYIAALFTPTERLFAQVWSSVNFDASGGEFTWNKNVFGGNGSTRIWDLPILAVDYQMGYWFVQRDSGRLRGLAPFVELHWNYAIAQNELLNAVNNSAGAYGLSVQGIGNTELNLTSGLMMQFGNNTNLVVGASAPLLNRPDRTFDVQFGLRLNYMFGRTAAARNPLTQISSY